MIKLIKIKQFEYDPQGKGEGVVIFVDEQYLY